VDRGVIEHGPDQLGFFRVEHGLDLDHAVLGVAAADIAALLIIPRVRVLAVALHEGVLARQLFELRGRHQPRIVEQQRLVRRRCHAHHRAHLRVRHHAAPERIINRREPGELAGDPHALSCGDQIPANPPGEPVCTRHRTLRVPAAARVELAQIGEQAMHGGIDVRGLFRNPLPQLLELAIHRDWIAHEPDISRCQSNDDAWEGASRPRLAVATAPSCCT
jgi:hypothetical protein